MIDLADYGAGARRFAEAEVFPSLALARVLSQHRELYGIVFEGGERLASVSGRFRHEAADEALYPAVGDFVMADIPSEPDSPAVIKHILPRAGVFERPRAGESGELQVIAANIDIVFICMSLNANYSLNRLERYLAVAHGGGAKPVVLLTKADLCADLDNRLAEARAAAIGADVLATSSLDGETPARVRAYFTRGVTASFIGSSGVGKSTLINALLGRDALATAEIRASDDRGRHTTTSRELMLLPSGGCVIDTPGMRELGADTADVGAAFSDIEALARRCRFARCSHTAEPDCAVKAALESGELDARRYESYLKLKKESRYDGMSAREIEDAKISAMFGSKSEMKKKRDFHKNKR